MEGMSTWNQEGEIPSYLPRTGFGTSATLSLFLPEGSCTVEGQPQPQPSRVNPSTATLSLVSTVREAVS